MIAFSGKRWISDNCLGGRSLKPEAVDVISDFTLMWNLFEGAVCHGNAHIRTFERLAETLAQRASVSAETGECVRFWSDRYRIGVGFNHLFQRLNFRPADRREHVEAVLRGEKDDHISQVLAVLIIVYRLRNNLFHGLKSIDTLNDQVPNLSMACQALAAIMKVSDIPFMDVKKAA
jgi:hypothetical protein